MNSVLRKFTIRERILVILLIAALPAIALFTYQSVQEYRSTYQEASDHLVRLAEAAARAESNAVQGVHNMLSAIGEIPFIKRRDRQACDDYLARITRLYPYYYNFYIVSADGEVACSGNPSVTSFDIRERSNYQTLIHERRFVGIAYQVNRRTGMPVASFVLPIIQEEELIGVAGATLRLEAFTAVARETRIPEEASITIVDAKGIIIGRKPTNLNMVGKPIASQKIIAGFSGQTSQVMEAAEAGEPRRLYAIAPALHEGRPIFYVIIGLDKSSLIAPAAKSLLISLTALLSLILLSLADTWWISHRLLITPINKLIDAAKQVTGGNLKARTGLGDQSGELAELAAQFDEMAAAIEKREEENLAARKLIEYLADHDELTKLPNRRFLLKHLAEKLCEAKKTDLQVGVLFLDIDRFRVINDSLGHVAGDRLLVAIAGRLLQDIETNGVATHLGGDEFVYVVPGISRTEQAMRAAQAILASVTQPYMIGDEKLAISASIGICLCPADADEGATAIKYAQVAMRHAKQSGNHVKFFVSEMNLVAMRRLRLESEMRQALERGEFLLYYQPQVSLQSKRIVSAEALLRWRHPQLGIISPTAFIALAEETRLILALGEWTLRTACSQSRSWIDMGLAPIQIAVNVSAHQFKQPGFTDLVAKALADNRLQARWLELEVTETALLDDVGYTLATLQEMGITLAIDDFGTGFSNLSYLRDLPVNKIKIDQSFIMNLAKSPGNQAIAQAIIAVARSLELKIIAEGVDSEETCRILHRMDCDEVQGYYCGKPMPADEFTALLQKNAPALWVA